MTQAQLEAYSDVQSSGKAKTQADRVLQAIGNGLWEGATIGEIERETGIPKHLVTARIKELMKERKVTRQVIGYSANGAIYKRREKPDPESGVRQTIHYSNTLDFLR